eukprot:COSAG06_NODE_5606_length_3366_cov_5.365473_3_plen_73_part_00
MFFRLKIGRTKLRFFLPRDCFLRLCDDDAGWIIWILNDVRVAFEKETHRISLFLSVLSLSGYYICPEPVLAI